MQKNEAGKSGLSMKALFTTALITIFAIGMMLAANLLFPFAQIERNAAQLYDLNVVREFFGMAVLGFSVFLLYTYIRNYFEVKSGFTLGLAFAVISFMLFAITSSPWFQSLVGIPAEDGLTIIPLFFALAGLAILAWVSSK